MAVGVHEWLNLAKMENIPVEPGEGSSNELVCQIPSSRDRAEGPAVRNELARE